MNTHFSDTTFFNEEEPEIAAAEENYLNVDEFFELASPEVSAYIEQPENESIFEFLPLEPFSLVEEEENVDYKPIKKAIKHKKIAKVEKARAKSEETKNVCFYIIQTTINAIKEETYQEKAIELVEEAGINYDHFVQESVRMKKHLTGPKALCAFLQSSIAIAKVFGAFMKWFLEEKYLRYAINHGEMKNIKGYIDFKNKEILPMLQ